VKGREVSSELTFGVQIHALPAEGWAERVRRIEDLGYSAIYVPDHFGPQWDPMVVLAAAAAVTERVAVGSLVYDVDYRHPVVYAKASATLHLIAGGRSIFGLGAGWMQTDYDQAGMKYDSPGVRIDRLAEALQIIRSMWTQEKTSFKGEHYQITEIGRAAPLPAGSVPKILIGGGGPRVLRLAGRVADIIGINPTLHEGRVTPRTGAELTAETVLEKVGWVRAAAERAGRDPASLEFLTLAFVVAIADDPRPIREAVGRNTGLSPEQVADSPLYLTGSPAEIRDRLQKRREAAGIGHVVLQGNDVALLERFAHEVIEPLHR
jgi:probable F420-dependent oxidoreductase